MDETFSNPTPVVNETSSRVMNQAEQEALDYYLQGGARTGDRNYRGQERRSVKSQLDRIVPTLLSAKVTINKPPEELTEAEELINVFQDYAPISHQEGMTLKAGAAKRIYNAARTKTGKPESAIKDRYDTFSGYLLDAANDLHVLDKGLTENEDIDVAAIRGSSDIHEAIAKQLMARGFLWDKFYPSSSQDRYAERHQYWLGFTLAASRFASDETVAHLFNFARPRANRRFRDWVSQMSEVENMSVVQKLIATGKITPITFARLWNRKAQQLELERDKQDTGQPPDRVESADIGDLVPEDARRDIEERWRQEEHLKELAEAEWDRAYEKKMQIPRMTTERARRELAAEGIGQFVLSQERFEQEYEQEIRETSERAKKPKPKTPPRPNRSGRKFPALRPWIRRQPGYDKRPPSDDLTLF